MRTLLLLALLACTGCVEDTYRIRVEPTDDGARRSIELKRSVGFEDNKASTMGADEIEAISALYGAGDEPLRYDYAADFSGLMPADTQGAGFEQRITGPLGTMRVYVERPRGERDIERSLERLWSAQALVIELMLEDVDSRFAGRPWLDELRALIDETIRSELRGIGLELWTAMQVSQPRGQNEDGTPSSRFKSSAMNDAYARIALRLVERGFVAPDEVFSTGMLGNMEMVAVTRFGKGYLARLLGEVAADEIWAEYERAAQMEQLDWSDHPRVLAWIAEHGGDPLSAASGLNGIVANYDQVDIEYVCPVAPLVTNGTWGESDGVIRWWLPVDADPAQTTRPAPTAFAMVVIPDQDVQLSVIGEVGLNGQDLANHLFWLGTLDEPARQRWRELIDAMADIPKQERWSWLFHAGIEDDELDRGITTLQDLVWEGPR